MNRPRGTAPFREVTPLVDPATGRRSDGGTDLDHLALLGAGQDRFAADLVDADPSAPVPACGRWTVEQLVVHLGEIYHWASGQARRQERTPLGRGPFDLVPFFTTQAAEVRHTLGALGPDHESWTLLGTGPASFWRRRQAHETLVHGHDLRAARLGSPTAAAHASSHDVPAVAWADAVDEVVHMFTPRQVLLGRLEPLARPVRLEASDVGRTWTLSGLDAGTATPAPEVTVRAPSCELALLLWRRLTVAEADLEVDGSRAALDAALAAPIVP